LDTPKPRYQLGNDAIEYDQAIWNKGNRRDIVGVDAVPCDVNAAYQPVIEITGDVANTINSLVTKVPSLLRADSALVPALDEMEMIREKNAKKTTCLSTHCS